jgi:hypothetical protein
MNEVVKFIVTLLSKRLYSIVVYFRDGCGWSKNRLTRADYSAAPTDEDYVTKRNTNSQAGWIL